MESEKIILSMEVLLDERYNGEKSYGGISALRTIYESEVEEFITYADNELDCRQALEMLKAILLLQMDLEHRQVKEWIIDNFALHKKVFSFSIEYLDYSDEDNFHPWLRKSNIYIERKSVEHVILFDEIYAMLYFGQYHLPIQYRTKDEPGDYYYEAPDPNEPTVFETIKNLLGIHEKS
jgi:hypothetical protein